MRYEAMKAIIGAAAFFVIGASIWYQAWVKPHDQYRNAIIDCMEEANDYSKEAYVSCGRNLDEKR
jgi:hypothetical protein